MDAGCAVKVVFVDTLHLFDETYSFLKDVESRYNFKALYFTPKDFKTAEEYQKVHGVDLPIRDIELYASCAS
jgi:phosphoadenosine phosphosulfate reductase